jgi:hypothetical protein
MRYHSCSKARLKKPGNLMRIHCAIQDTFSLVTGRRMNWPHALLAALVFVSLPQATEAQIGVRLGSHIAAHRGDEVHDSWRVGWRATLVPYERVSMSLLVDRVLGELDDDSVTTLRGWRGTARIQVRPFAEILYLGVGFHWVHERYTIERRFYEVPLLDSGWTSGVIGGLEFPLGRLHPFFEVDVVNLTGGGANRWSYVLGLDVSLGQLAITGRTRTPRF